MRHPVILVNPLQVVELEDRYWVQCACETARGRLPTAHITPVDNIPALTATQKIYVVVTDFSGGDPGTLQPVSYTHLTLPTKA